MRIPSCQGKLCRGETHKSRGCWEVGNFRGLDCGCWGLWLIAAVVMVAGLFFSLSRMGIISAIASLAVMAAFSGFQRKAGLWVAAGIMTCGIILVLWMGG